MWSKTKHEGKRDVTEFFKIKLTFTHKPPLHHVAGMPSRAIYGPLSPGGGALVVLALVVVGGGGPCLSSVWAGIL